MTAPSHSDVKTDWHGKTWFHHEE